MKNIAFVIVYFSMGLFASAQNCNITDVRDLYYKSLNSKKSAEELLKKTECITVADPVLYGYKAIADVMMCHHAYNPYMKLKYFSSGKEKLEEAVAKEKDNIELRYLRFTVQCNTPEILNYRRNLGEDKKKLLNYLLVIDNKKEDEDLYKRIKEFMGNCMECSEEEKDKIKKL